MTRVRIFACVGAGLALVAFGWYLPTLQSAAADGMNTLISRSAGLALFGIAMVAAGLAFRTAMMTPKAPRAETESVAQRLGTSEFRRGFAKSGKPQRVKTAAEQPTEREVVVALRRAVAEHGSQRQERSSTALPSAEVERLQDLLHTRAAQLRARNSEQAQRRFLQSGVDIQGLAQR